MWLTCSIVSAKCDWRAACFLPCLSALCHLSLSTACQHCATSVCQHCATSVCQQFVSTVCQHCLSALCHLLILHIFPSWHPQHPDPAFLLHHQTPRPWTSCSSTCGIKQVISFHFISRDSNLAISQQAFATQAQRPGHLATGLCLINQRPGHPGLLLHRP